MSETTIQDLGNPDRKLSVKKSEQPSCSSAAHAEGRPFTCLAMVPPQLVGKWARECFLTLPNIRVFMIDGVRNGVGSNGFTGVNEVRSEEHTSELQSR